MHLYFLRHAPALARSEWSGTDDLRPLSDHGEETARTVARRIAELDLALDVILTSPFERALRTAVIVHEALGGVPPLVQERLLEPARFNPKALASLLAPHAKAGNVMLVGHDPSMTSVLSPLVGGGRFQMKKGGLALVEFDPHAPTESVLKWFVPPRLLR